MTDNNKITGEPDGATPLSPEEMEGLVQKHVTTRGQLDELEQFNIQEGMRWLKRQKNKDPLSEDFIRKMHKKLFGSVWNWAGSFRKTEKNIGCDPLQIAVNLRKLLDDTRYWYEHDTYLPLEIAARFHHRLVQIHVFPNGNGRHARIMANAVLTMALKEKPIDWSGGQNLQAMSAKRTEYINALRAADGHDYKPLLNYVGAS